MIIPNRGWRDFCEMYGTETARLEFEKACAQLWKKKYPNENVQRVEVYHGDGGVDIYVGNLGQNPIRLIQCKFFLKDFGDAQKAQIENSLETAVNSKKYTLEKWTLCIPKVLTVDENANWNKWKAGFYKKYNVKEINIELINGDQLINEFKDYGLYTSIFHIDNQKKLDEIYECMTANATKDIKKIKNYDQYQKSLLKIAYLISSDINLCNAAKKKCFDIMILTTIDYKKKVSFTEMVQTLSEKEPIDETQLKASLQRLLGNNYISLSSDFYSINKGFEQNATIYNDFDIIFQKIKEIIQKNDYKIPEGLLPQVELNMKNAILWYYKIYSYDILVEDYQVQISDFDDLKDILGEKLPSVLAGFLNSAIGELLKNPSPEIEIILTRIRRCFVGLRFLGLDPEVRKTNRYVFEKKCFFLDTDFTLGLLVKESSKAELHKKLITFLIKNGAEIVIPDEILNEIADHAKYAHKQYAYIESDQDAVPLDILLERVHNVFIEGYLIGYQLDKKMTFEKYLENYYYEKEPITFLKQLLQDEIFEQQPVKFMSFDSLKKDNHFIELYDSLYREVIQLTLKTPKAGYRTTEENKRIAENDVLLYLACHIPSAVPFSKGKTLQAITDSTRSMVAAKDVGEYKPHYIKAIALANYFEAQDSAGFTYKDISAACLNPFLYYAVNGIWEKIKRIVELGGNLQGRGLTRLKIDFSDSAENKLQAFNAPISEEELQTIKKFTEKGYTFTGEVAKIINDNKEIETLKRRIAELENKNKAREKYLKKYIAKAK